MCRGRRPIPVGPKTSMTISQEVRKVALGPSAYGGPPGHVMDVSGLMMRDATSRTSGCDILRFVFHDLLILDSHLDPAVPMGCRCKIFFLHDVCCVIHDR